MSTRIDLEDVAAGTGGFRILGAEAGDNAGFSVASAGDIDGDGIDDLVIGSIFGGGDVANGAVHVVFGRAGGFADPVDLDEIAAGVGGFKLTGEHGLDWAGWSVATAGDVNHDGIDDVVVGSWRNDSAADHAHTGAAYVVFGKTGGFASPVDLAAIAAGTGGFRIEGEGAGDNAGFSVAPAGDIDGDGIDDLVVGARTKNNGLTVDSGAAYVVFGRDVASEGGFATPVHLATIGAGNGGFKIRGEATDDRAGWSVSAAGDVNGDGRDDLIVGAPFNDGGGEDAGAAYVVFGKAGGFAVPTELGTVAAGNGGFKIQGRNAGDQAGVAVSAAGDVNGDGFDDVVLGARYQDGGGGDAGAAYVVFGRNTVAQGGFATPVDLDDIAQGTGGFEIRGEAAGDFAGFSVASAGDVNGDGRGDLVVGALRNDGGGDRAGAAYAVFGRAAGFPAVVDLATVAAGSGGFKLQGGHAGDEVGRSVASAGDVNDDGFDDIVVGVPLDDSDGTNNGAAYIVYGFATGPVARDDSFTASGASPAIAGNVIANPGGADSDPQGDTLTVAGVGAAGGQVGTAVAGSGGGLFTIQADGALTFDPNGDFDTLASGQSRTTRVTYTITERDGGQDSATATVIVTGTAAGHVFTPGNDTVDLNAFDLAAYTNAQVTRALAGKDVVQLSQTQKLGVAFDAGGGSDTVTGSSSTDRVHGGAGKDWLQGRNGDDTLWGDAGDDTLTGGAGNDRFVFEDFGTAASPEVDAIADFAFGVTSGNKDVIDLTALHLADWTGSDSQITVTGSGSSRTIHVDLHDDHSAANNTTQAELVICVNAGAGGVRNFVISDTNPLADILV